MVFQGANPAFLLDNDVYETFCIALRLTNENENEAVENWWMEKMRKEVTQ